MAAKRSYFQTEFYPHEPHGERVCPTCPHGQLVWEHFFIEAETARSLQQAEYPAMPDSDSFKEWQVEALATRVQAATIKLHGCTQGHCREAAIVLVENLLDSGLVDRACVCQGVYGEHGHYWARIMLGQSSWVVHPTVDQFDPQAPLMALEVSARAYKQHSCLLYSGSRLTELRKQVRLNPTK